MAEPRRRLWIVWSDAAADLTLADPVFRAAPGLWLIRSARPRSTLYHAGKRQLPDVAALLVAQLADDPKAKGLAPGVRRFLDDGGAQ